MEPQQISANPDVYRIAISRSTFKATNCYVVVSGDDALVIDPGMPLPGTNDRTVGFAPADFDLPDEPPDPTGEEVFSAALRKIGAAQRNLSFFVTHRHIDHFNLLRDAAPPGAVVYLGRVERDAVAYERTEEADCYLLGRMDEIGMPRDQSLDYVHKLLALARPRLEGDVNYVFLEDGDEVSVGSERLRAVLTPGHAAGHLCLYHPKAGYVFTGDQVLFSISPNLDYNHSARSDCWQDNLESLMRLRALGCDWGLAGHGSSSGSLIGRIDYLHDHRKDRAVELAEVVAGRPGISTIGAVRSLRWNVAGSDWSQIGQIQRSFMIAETADILDHLEKTDELRSELDDKGIRRYWPTRVW